jgi:hypothetical protein
LRVLAEGASCGMTFVHVDTLELYQGEAAAGVG